MNSLACKFKIYFIIFIIFCVTPSFQAQTITTGAVNSTLICRGGLITVSFVTNGTFQEGRKFKIQLSNPAGNFSATNYFGELELQCTSSGIVSRSITGEIQSSIPAGNVYRVRVVYFSGGNHPSVIGTTNAQNIKIVNSKVNPSFTLPTSICSGESLILPSVSSNGVAGTWSPAFDNVPALNTTTNYIFTPSTGLCANQASKTITVMANIDPVFDSVSPICSGDSFALPTISENGISGTWSPAIDNTSTTAYTFTPSTGTCATTSTMTVVVNPIVSPTFNQVAAICSGDSFALPTISENGISGTWSPELNFIETTTYTFTPTIVTCATTSTMTVVVNPIITPTFAQVATICEGTEFDLPTVSENGITGTWSPELNNLTTTTYTFTPTNGYCVTTNDLIVVVNPKLTPTFDIISSICTGDSIFGLPQSSLNGIIGSWFPSLNNQETTEYTFTPSSDFCATQTSSTLVVNPIVTIDTNVIAYQSYTWPANGQTYYSSGNYSFVSGCSERNLNLTINHTCILDLPGLISDIEEGLCLSGLTTPTFLIAPVSNATSYLWTVPSGVTIVSGQGTTSVTLVISNSFSSGTLSVSASNECGTSPLRSIMLRSTIPLTPLSISGITTGLCANGVNNPNYSIATVSGAISYLWTAPAGTTIISGQGTTSITLNITNNFTSGSLTVAALNECGSSALRSMILRSAIPTTPLGISGITSGLCANGVNNPSYSIAAVSGATSYIWTAPAGTTITSGQGTTSITLNITNSFTSGSLTVAALNECGASTLRTMILRSAIPTTPLGISGITTGLCSSGITNPCYSIAPVSGAISYVWSAPIGTTIVSGQGTTSITLNITNSFTTGTLTVAASNECGLSQLRSMALTSSLLIPTTIIGSITPCGTETYTCPSVVNANSYIWAVPNGMEIVSGQGTTSITVNVIGSSLNGNISVKASNNCKIGGTKTLAINSCSSNTKMSAPINQELEYDIESEIEAIVFPNPTNSEVNVQFLMELNENVKIEIFDMIGKKVSSEEVQAGRSFVNMTLEGMPLGIYLLQASKSNGVLIYTTKLLKQ